MTPFDFLNALWQYKPEDQYILIWTGADKRSRWFLDVAEAAAYAASAVGDVYTGVGLAGKDYGPHNRCPSGEITAIAGIGGDFDILSEAHTGKALPQTIEQAYSIHEALLTPTFTILTGNGIQSWWVLREPCVFENDADRQAVARTLGRWHTLLKVNAASHGWAYERLADLARLLRVPGTKNCKDPAQIKDVTLHSESDCLYNMSDVEELLDVAQVPDADAQQRAAQEWKAKFADTPLVVNREARISQETLDLWMGKELLEEKDATRFRHTWNRERHDLQDNSNSGYDMALIHFGLDIKLPEQQIVDLIVAHRAHHGVKQKLDAGYFRRSIVKARTAREEKIRSKAALTGIGPLPQVNGHAPTGGAPAPAPAAAEAIPESSAMAPPDATATAAVNGQPAPPDSPVPPPVLRGLPPPENIAKLLLCEKLSAILGIDILKMVCIDGKDQTFHMHTAAHGIVVFEDVSGLINFRMLENKLAGKTRRIINPLKAKEFQVVRQMLLDACIIEEPTEEEEFEGGARSDVTDYLTETEFIRTIEGQSIQDQKRPLLHEGQILVASSDFAAYLEKTKNRKTTNRMAASMLVALGARKGRARSTGRQARWVLPLPDGDRPGFDPQAIRPGMVVDQETSTGEAIQ